jgi:endogenous inhibitor of DNA gyrase (YacG/DUF329 family)
MITGTFGPWDRMLIPCGWCGRRVPQTETGRGRRWCSNACRMKSYRAHQRTHRGSRDDRLNDSERSSGVLVLPF